MFVDEGLEIPELGKRRVEVGCGHRARAAQGAEAYVGIDVHDPYLTEARRRYPAADFICADWEQALETFGDCSFSGLYAIDFIEHLDRADGERFLREAERVAERVAIFTPVGPMQQIPRDGEPESQRHRSAWRPSDFAGWSVEVLLAFHHQLANGAPLDVPISAFWAVSNQESE